MPRQLEPTTGERRVRARLLRGAAAVTAGLAMTLVGLGFTSRAFGTLRAPLSATGPAAVSSSASGSSSAGRPELQGTCAGASGGQVGCLSPQAIRTAYDVSPLLAKGINGQGETVVIPAEGGGNARPGRPTLASVKLDLAAYDRRYHLSAADVHVSTILGASRTGALVAAQDEAVLDAETVHAIAPKAKLELMVFPQSALLGNRLGVIIGDAARRGDIVSTSYGRCEGCLSPDQRQSLDVALQQARNHHVSVFAASGDVGAAGTTSDGMLSQSRGVSLPAAAPLVTGVGGTELTINADGSYRGETVWNEYPTKLARNVSSVHGATGGGVSAIFSRPAYQHGLPAIGDHRGVPDVSADAALKTGFATVTVREGREIPKGGEIVRGEAGTSESTPFWAGIAALADQYAGRQLGFLNGGLYRIGHSRDYHGAFHDVTHGNNSLTLPSGKHITGDSARPGWDPVTGWGSPDVAKLVPLLGREVRPGDGGGL